jgi:hypothetical protein
MVRRLERRTSKKTRLGRQRPSDGMDSRLLEARRVEADAKLADLTATPPAADTGDATLLDAMPQIDVRLSDLPERLQRELFDVLNLQVRLPNTYRAHIKITLTADTPRALDARMSAAHTPYDPAAGQDNQPTKRNVTDRIDRDDARLPALVARAGPAGRRPDWPRPP